MIGIILKGMGLGIALAMLIGPVFFILIQTSMRKGFVPAFFLALGISASDAIYIFLTYFGFAQFSENPLFIKILGLGGGIILVLFGLFMLVKKPRYTQDVSMDISNKERLKYFIKGFTLNFINPSVLLFWVGAVGMVSLDLDYYNYKIATFFGATVFTVFATDLIKIYLSKKLSHLLNDTVMSWINKVSGVAMILYGTILFFQKI